MGSYINSTQNGPLNSHGKAKSLLEAGAKEVSGKEFQANLICVVNNGPFEAAAYCPDEMEYRVFNHPSDNRPKKWLTWDRVQEFAS